MSCIFDVEGETVWSPSLQVVLLYVSTARCLADYVRVSSGLIANSEDMYDLDPQAFPRLIHQVARSDASAHPVYDVPSGEGWWWRRVPRRGPVRLELERYYGHPASRSAPPTSAPC